MGPDCHLVRTAIHFLPFVGQPRCFPLQSNRFLASFAGRVSWGNYSFALARARTGFISSIRQTHARQATSAHSVTNTKKIVPDAPHCRFIICFVRRSRYHIGSTSMHKNRSPREQGRGNHAIGNRPEIASAKALPPSTHPKLGVSSKHQRFHRCAL